MVLVLSLQSDTCITRCADSKKVRKEQEPLVKRLPKRPAVLVVKRIDTGCQNEKGVVARVEAVPEGRRQASHDHIDERAHVHAVVHV
jgi:hypothetical protein